MLRQYPEGRILEEYEVTAGGMPGAAFDLVWLTGSGLRLHTRACYVPTPAGLFEFLLMVNPAQLKEYHGAFNSVLITFRLVPAGQKLELPAIPNRS